MSDTDVSPSQRRAALAVVAAVVVGVVGAIVLIVVLHYANKLHPPSRAESERDLTGGISDALHQPVTVACQTPTTHGWTCLLRSADGRYGAADGSLSGETRRTPQGRFAFTSTDVNYTWSMTVAADGRVDVTLPGASDTTPDSGEFVSLLSGVVLHEADHAVGAVEVDPVCPELRVGTSVVCTRAGEPSVTITRAASGTDRFQFTEPLPGAAAYRADPALPRPPAPPAR